jgi:hypothetical protein
MNTLNAGDVSFLSIHLRHITSTVCTNQKEGKILIIKTPTAVDIFVCTVIKK